MVERANSATRLARMPPAVSGILLAGGASSRFGRDKLVAFVGGLVAIQFRLLRTDVEY